MSKRMKSIILFVAAILKTYRYYKGENIDYNNDF